MDLKIQGRQVLSGEIKPSGSKNSAVALIPASILFKGDVILENTPDITDVQKLVRILKKLGGEVVWDKEKNLLKINNSGLSYLRLGTDDLGDIRGTSLLWGPMLARFKKIDFAGLPGGCTLGFRTLEPHFQALKDLGVKISGGRGDVKMDARRAKPGTVWLREMSPTATENIIMFATSLPGKTKIIGAASEPQVQDLCSLLIKAGLSIRGVGSSILEINGGYEVAPLTHRILSDHYEIATFTALAAATGGKVTIYDSLPDIMDGINWIFGKFGVGIEHKGTTAHVFGPRNLKIVEDEGRGILTVKAQPWPGLPVDTLPLFIPLALAAKNGQVLFHNWMYDAGLFWTSELLKLGANIVMNDPHRVLVTAGNKLHSATLEAPYIIRAVVALIMSAMIAEGESKVLNADALYRGHPDFAKKLQALGARVGEV